MLNTREHRPNHSFRISSDYSSNSTHTKPSTNYTEIYLRNLWISSDLKRMALAERVEHAKCCAACRSQVINTNQRWTTLKYTCANGAHLRLLTFVLCLQRHLLFASILV